MAPKFYLDIEDTTEEVGITRRQLTYWQQEGLLVPEYGAGAKKFTEVDIRRLRILKRLIVEQNLPLSFVKKIVDGETGFAIEFVQTLIETGALLSKNPDELSRKVLDFNKGRLIPSDALAEEVWTAKQAVASEEEIQDVCFSLALLLFRTILVTQNHPAAYQDRLDKFFDTLRTISEVARISWWIRERDGKTLARFSFKPELDPSRERSLTFYEVWPDFLHYGAQLEVFANAATKLVENSEAPHDVLKRFWRPGLVAQVSEATEYEPPFLSGDGSTLSEVPF